MRRNMKVSNFEQQIDPVILERGREYWLDGLVSNLHWDEETLVASVKGTSLYEVEIEFSGSEIEDVYCNCPYDWDDYCKHVVAVLFAQKNNDIPASDDSLVRELLQTMNVEELRKLLEEILSKEPHWQERVLARASTEGNEVFRRYDTLLKEKINACSDRYGFIGYHQAAEVSQIGEELLSEVNTLLEDQEYEQALAISKAVLINMNTAISDADDSNGFIGGAAQEAISCFEMIAQSSEAPPGIINDLFSTLTDQDFLSQFTDFGWHHDLMEIAVNLAGSKEREKYLFDTALSFIGELGAGPPYSYGESWYQQLRLRHLLKFSSVSETERFIDDNVGIPFFRKMKLETLYRAGRHDDVIRLAQEGARQDLELPGLLRDWREWILKGAEAKNDLELQREILRQLYSASRNIMYYKTLKSKYSEFEWVEIRDSLLESFAGYWGQKAEIFIEENMIDSLWNLISQNRSLEVLSNYDRYFFPQYAEEIRGIYRQLISESLERIKDRKHYRCIAEILSSRKKQLGPGFCNRLVEDLIRLFPNRPAMRDEFQQAGLL